MNMNAKKEMESVKKDNQARRGRPTSNEHIEDKTQHTSENCSSTPDIKNALEYKQRDRQSYEQEINNS
jgi:hypothetical protein